MATPKVLGRILIIPRGDYSATTQYDSLDLVRYDSKSWLCKTDGITGITPTEGTDWTCIAQDGTDGTDGADGIGIVNIQRTGTDPSNPLVDIYTITYTDGTTSTFTVTNGSGGTTVDTMLKSVYDADDDGIVDEAKHADNVGTASTAILEAFNDAGSGLYYNRNKILFDVDQLFNGYNSAHFKVTKYGKNGLFELADYVTTKLSKVDNNTRRTRRNITSDLTNLPTAIAEQNLEKYGYAIGDYFVGASGYYYYLADMDTNYGGYNSYAVVDTHHCGIVVDTKSTCQWLASGSVTNYSSSTLHSFLTNTALPNIKSDIAMLFGDWENHLLKRNELDNAIGGWGTTWDGLKDCLICAMTEVQMYGARVFGADGNQIGTGSKSLELFRKYRFNEIYGNTPIWLKNLFSASFACLAYGNGVASDGSVSYSHRASGLILFH